ncbi:proton-conducting transporter membrane subunit [Streptomyces sp. DSM 44917]|uniref:Proton-conducting transporter membrane subunit n=1 Tax=Streptomyces boetiae TaxID=3075541 RepID=A0ABU2L4M8_9ACTN|nr:proton-conducting transporter membrane subunit [Streptomyces sp. DSM 44917]MDT0306514.1 proton-conducting transporter membrane subunit [Streptomyces sp. DSM 44917]
MSGGWLLWTLVGLPLLAGALLTGAGRAADRIAPGAALAVAGAATVLAGLAAASRPAAGAPLLEGLPARLAVDGLSSIMVVTVAAVTLLVLVFSAAECGPEQARARFFGLVLVFAGAMLLTVTATTLPLLLMAWEVMGAASWALIGYWWREPERVEAAAVAFLTTRAGDLGLYLAAGAALAGGPAAATLALEELPATAEPWLSLATAGLLAAALGKSAQLPFSFWLSRAMQGPSPVSALLHSATMVVAGAYLLLRTGPLLEATGWGAAVVAWTGAATAVALGLVAIAQTELKQLLAASSCAQIGFMVLAAGVGSAAGGTVQLTAHAAAKSLAFLVAGAWLAGLGTQELTGLRGAARGHRTLGLTFTVALLALAGLPPLALWAAKDVLLAAALADSPWLYAAGLTAAALSAVYSARVLWFVWRPARRGPAAGRLPPVAGAPLMLLAAGCLALSVCAFPVVRESLGRVLGSGEPAVRGWEFALSGAVALAGGALAWAWGDRAPPPASARLGRWCAGWLGLERAVRVGVVAPVLRLARALAAFDDRVLDPVAEAAARGTVGLARAVEVRSERRIVDRAVEGFAAGVGRCGRLARRPQTGRLHQYLAQAVTGLTALAVVFVLVR